MKTTKPAGWEWITEPGTTARGNDRVQVNPERCTIWIKFQGGDYRRQASRAHAFAACLFGEYERENANDCIYVQEQRDYYMVVVESDVADFAKACRIVRAVVEALGSEMAGAG